MIHAEIIKYLRGLKSVCVLTRNILFEAGNQPYLGKQAVAAVTLNRVFNPKNFPNTVNEVILAPYQFSWTNKGMLPPNHIKAPWLDNPLNWAKCKEVAEMALTGNMVNPVNGCCYYFNPHLAQPSWAKKMVKVLSIADHDFYWKPGDPKLIIWDLPLKEA